MSYSKRRKLDAQVAPQREFHQEQTALTFLLESSELADPFEAAVSAISALAARRRQAATTPAREPSPSPETEETTPARTNAFSVLQNLKRNSDSPKSPKKGSKPGSNKANFKSFSQSKPRLVISHLLLTFHLKLMTEI